MVSPPTAAWSSLSNPWRAAFGQAWRSWTEGNLGIGAVLIDPSSGATVSVGRNRVNTSTPAPEPAPAVLNGTFMAHAEMNAFAAMGRYRADGLHLYTTLEPCLMCAATTLFLHVEHVHYAVPDEFFDGMDELWDQHPYPQRHKPERTGPLDPQLAALARALPLSAQARQDPDDPVLTAADAVIPTTVALARELAVDGTLEAVAAEVGPDGPGASAGAVDPQAESGALAALTALWDRLPA